MAPTQADFSRPRRMVFFFDAPETFSVGEHFFIYNSALTAIYGSNPEVVILESEETKIPPTPEGKQELARRVDADSWVFVQVQGDPSNVTFYYETFDMLTFKRIGEKTIDTKLRIDLRALTRSNLWSDLVSAIRDNYSALLNREDLTITGLPGTVISNLPSEEEIVLDETGSVTMSLQTPFAYNYRAALNGYYTVQEEFYLGFEDITLELEQKPAINWSLEFSLNNIQFLGFQAYWFPVPADVFISFGFTTYALGLYFISNSPELFHVNPLSVLKLHFGSYFFDKANLLRPYSAIGAGLRIEHSAERFGIDETTPVEISLVGGLEYSFPDRFLRFYVEYNPIMFISNDVQEFRAKSFWNYLFTNNEIPGYVFCQPSCLRFQELFCRHSLEFFNRSFRDFRSVYTRLFLRRTEHSRLNFQKPHP